MILSPAMSRRWLLRVSAAFLVLHLYFILRELLAPGIRLPGPPNAIRYNTFILMLFSLTHAIYSLGGRRAWGFFALSGVVSYLFEEVGVRTGWIYGRYHYSDMLGAKLGSVPLLIPLAWFMMSYPAYVLVNLIAERRPFGTSGSLGRAAWLAALSAMVMTAWDLPMDPLMSRQGHWIWEEGGPYFGVPLHNYAGWLITTFTVYLIFRLWERRPEDGVPASWEGREALGPLVAYASFALYYGLHAEPLALRLISLFAMGMPCLFAADRLRRDDGGAAR